MSSFGDFVALSDICDVPTAKIISREVSGHSCILIHAWLSQAFICSVFTETLTFNSYIYNYKLIYHLECSYFM